MTITEILAQVDEIKPNTYDDNIKMMWLSDLDGKIFNDVILTHERDEDDTSTSFEPYESINSELLVDFPHEDIYRNYLFAQIDFANGETDRYTNSMIMFNASYKSFTSDYNRNHMPISHTLSF